MYGFIGTLISIVVALIAQAIIIQRTLILPFEEHVVNMRVKLFELEFKCSEFETQINRLNGFDN